MTKPYDFLSSIQNTRQRANTHQALKKLLIIHLPCYHSAEISAVVVINLVLNTTLLTDSHVHGKATQHQLLLNFYGYNCQRLTFIPFTHCACFYVFPFYSKHSDLISFLKESDLPAGSLTQQR